MLAFNEHGGQFNSGCIGLDVPAMRMTIDHSLVSGRNEIATMRAGLLPNELADVAPLQSYNFARRTSPKYLHFFWLRRKAHGGQVCSAALAELASGS